MFKVNNKDTRMTPMASATTPCSSVSIVNLEHVIADWESFFLMLDQQLNMNREINEINSKSFLKYETLYAIWYHFYNLKNVKNTHGGVRLLNFTKSNTPPWVFFTFFKLYKWYQKRETSHQMRIIGNILYSKTATFWKKEVIIRSFVMVPLL